MKIAIDYVVKTSHCVAAVCPDCYGFEFVEVKYDGQRYFKCINSTCRATGVWPLATLQRFAQEQSLESMRKIMGNDNVIYPGVD